MDNKILIVDDETSVLSSLKRALMEESYEILTAECGVEGLDILKEHKVTVVISDEKMPGMPGSEFLAAVKKLFPHTVRMMLTGHASLESAMNAVNNGEIYRFFSKPWDDIQIKLAIRSAIEKYNLEDENRRLLKTVKRQADELKQLEEKHPGISSLKKDQDGSFILSETSESVTDLNEAVAEIVSDSK